MKNGLQMIKGSLGRIPTKIWSENIAVGVCQNFWQPSVDRAGRPSTVRFPTVERSVDWVGRPQSQPESETLCRSTNPVDRVKKREQRLAPGRPGQATDVHICTVVHVGRPGRSTGLGQICFSQRLQKGKGIFGKNLWLGIYKIEF